MKSLSKLILFSLLLISSLSVAKAASFERAQFDQLQREGKPILVAVHAEWCSTCKRQIPIVSRLLKKEKYADITEINVDFDTQKDVVKFFKVPMQSTLIVFKNGKEVGRSIGETSEEKLEALLDKAL
jgi:thioredoxin 1